jgi:hypothetical protein
MKKSLRWVHVQRVHQHFNKKLKRLFPCCADTICFLGFGKHLTEHKTILSKMNTSEVFKFLDNKSFNVTRNNGGFLKTVKVQKENLICV